MRKWVRFGYHHVCGHGKTANLTIHTGQMKKCLNEESKSDVKRQVLFNNTNVICTPIIRSNTDVVWEMKNNTRIMSRLTLVPMTDEPSLNTSVQAELRAKQKKVPFSTFQVYRINQWHNHHQHTSSSVPKSFVTDDNPYQHTSSVFCPKEYRYRWHNHYKHNSLSGPKEFVTDDIIIINTLLSSSSKCMVSLNS